MRAITNIDRPSVLSFVNQHALNLAFEDPETRKRFLKADWLLRDGVGLEVAMTVLHLAPGKNCNGTDLIPRILQRMPGKRIVLFGTKEPWLSAAEGVLRGWGLVVTGSLDGFQPTEAYTEFVKHAPRCRSRRNGHAPTGIDLIETSRASALGRVYLLTVAQFLISSRSDIRVHQS